MLTTEHHLAACRKHAENALAIAERTMELAGLSKMQRVVARGLLKGMSNKELAADIGIDDQTVKNHITGINKRLGTFDRTQIVLTLQGVL
jgi:DNA-binding NarL/FixJ family response regulator